MMNATHAYRGSEAFLRRPLSPSSMTEERLKAHMKRSFAEGGRGMDPNATPRTPSAISSAASRAETLERQTPPPLLATPSAISSAASRAGTLERQTCIGGGGGGGAPHPLLAKIAFSGWMTSACHKGQLVMVLFSATLCAVSVTLCAVSVTLCRVSCRLLLWTLTLLWELCRGFCIGAGLHQHSHGYGAQSSVVVSLRAEKQLVAEQIALLKVKQRALTARLRRVCGTAALAAAVWGVSAGCSALSFLGWGLMCAATVVLCKGISDARLRASEWRRRTLFG